MKKKVLTMMSAASLMASLFVFTPTASANCYTFRGVSDVGVCVQGNNDRKATEICKSKVGGECSVASYSSSCHSNSNRCYDENGEAHRDLSGY